MSPLPQRKKSAEEIAKLRETLGIPGEAPPPPDFANETPPAPPPPAPAPAPAPPPEARPPEGPEQNPTSNEKAEPGRKKKSPDTNSAATVFLSVPPEEDSSPAPLPAAEPAVEAPVRLPKPVRSLKKSEQLPLESRPRSAPKPDSAIPVKRRSDQDLNEIRRREALAMQGQPPLFAPLLAHPAVLAAGYLLAIGGGIFAWRDFHFAWPATSEAFALAVAAFVFFKKTLSRHHAGFIAILAVFIAIFAALHYFPQLENAP